VVTCSGLGPAAEPQWLKDLRAEIEIGRRNLAVNVAVAAAEQTSSGRNGSPADHPRRLPEEGGVADAAAQKFDGTSERWFQCWGPAGHGDLGEGSLGFDRLGRKLSMVR
jgi:hypothetical protein